MLVLFAPFSLFAQNEEINKYLQKPLPNEWLDDDDAFQQILPVEDLWWKSFDDPILDSLIDVAAKQNYSVLMALNRIDMAKANLGTAKADYYPTLSLDGGWTKEQSSGNISSAPKARDNYFSTTLTTSWELDVFGSIRKRVKAQEKTFEATREDYNATMVSLSSQVASAYINLRGAQQELVVLKKNCESQNEVLKITEIRYNAGLVSKLDVVQAKSVYYNTKASIPSVEASIIKYVNSLSVLLGVYPQQLSAILEKPGKLPNYTELVGVGLPASLLRRRPDIRSVERQVEAKASLLGASKADWLPTFLVNASVGYESQNLKNLTQSNSLTYEISPTITINLFEGGKRKYATKLAQFELEETINDFNETVLTAVQEVNNAMSSYRNSVRQVAALREVLVHGRESFDLSLELYEQGLSPFQNVLDAQRSLLSYEDSLVEAETNSLLYLIQMYQALGGGWNN